MAILYEEYKKRESKEVYFNNNSDCFIAYLDFIFLFIFEKKEGNHEIRRISNNALIFSYESLSPCELLTDSSCWLQSSNLALTTIFLNFFLVTRKHYIIDKEKI